MKVHAPRFTIISCIAISEEMVQEPANYEVGWCPIHSPASVPCPSICLCVAMDLHNGIVNCNLLHLRIRESVLDMRACRAEVLAIRANGIISSGALGLYDVSPKKVREESQFHALIAT